MSKLIPFIRTEDRNVLLAESSVAGLTSGAWSEEYVGLAAIRASVVRAATEGRGEPYTGGSLSVEPPRRQSHGASPGFLPVEGSANVKAKWWQGLECWHDGEGVRGECRKGLRGGGRGL